MRESFVNRINHYIVNKQIRKMKWGQLGSFCIYKGFNIIGSEHIFIGESFYAEGNLRLQAWTRYGEQSFNPRLIIGNNVSFMDNCQITCCNCITIKDGCLFGANVFVTDNYHGNNSIEQSLIPPIERPLLVKDEVTIGKNVWVGRNVCIMPGVTIGDGAVIGANAVVTKDIPAYSVAVGVPAKVLRSGE